MNVEGCRTAFNVAKPRFEEMAETKFLSNFLSIEVFISRQKTQRQVHMLLSRFVYFVRFLTVLNPLIKIVCAHSSWSDLYFGIDSFIGLQD